MQRFSNPVRNGLHGHRAHIMPRIRDEQLPKWLYPSHPMQRPSGQSLTVTTPNPRNGFLRRWREIATNRNCKQTINYRLFINRSEVSDESFPLFNRPPEIVLAPTKVRRRCEEYLSSPRHRSEMRTLGGYGSFDGFHISVVIGPRGGIQDITLTADYLR